MAMTLVRLHWGQLYTARADKAHAVGMKGNAQGKQGIKQKINWLFLHVSLTAMTSSPHSLLIQRVPIVVHKGREKLSQTGSSKRVAYEPFGCHQDVLVLQKIMTIE